MGEYVKEYPLAVERAATSIVRLRAEGVEVDGTTRYFRYDGQPVPEGMHDFAVEVPDLTRTRGEPPWVAAADAVYRVWLTPEVQRGAREHGQRE